MTSPFDISALVTLGDVLASRGLSFNAIVIGGANLIVHEIVDRSTEDVDMVAQADDHGNRRPALPIPPKIEQAIADVAVTMGLLPNWFNADSSLIFSGNLPPGIESRLKPQTFGTLTIWWVSLFDLVAFKRYAAIKKVDDPNNRYRRDLDRLDHTQESIDAAVIWIHTLVPERSKKLATLNAIVGDLGYDT